MDKYVEIKVENSEHIETKKTNKPLYVGIFFTLFCIGLGIMCIMIPLKKNESDKKGSIIYVFYLGVLILFCVCFFVCNYAAFSLVLMGKKK